MCHILWEGLNPSFSSYFATSEVLLQRIVFAFLIQSGLVCSSLESVLHQLHRTSLTSPLSPNPSSTTNSFQQSFLNRCPQSPEEFGTVHMVAWAWNYAESQEEEMPWRRWAGKVAKDLIEIAIVEIYSMELSSAEFDERVERHHTIFSQFHDLVENYRRGREEAMRRSWGEIRYLFARVWGGSGEIFVDVLRLKPRTTRPSVIVDWGILIVAIFVTDCESLFIVAIAETVTPSTAVPWRLLQSRTHNPIPSK